MFTPINIFIDYINIDWLGLSQSVCNIYNPYVRLILQYFQVNGGDTEEFFTVVSYFCVVKYFWGVIVSGVVE